jgi:hypothetical protein
LRNITDNELYVNVDHTRDFVTGKLDTYRSTYNGHVFFSNVRVSSVQELLTIPYTVDLFTYEHGCAGWLWVRSGWAGQLDLHGKQWRLGIVDNLDGQIGTNDLLCLESLPPQRSEPTICVSPVPRTLFLNGCALDLGFAFKSSPTGAVLETTLAECQPPLGQLRIAVQHGKFLRLQDGPTAVILAAKAGTVDVPAGNYQIADCLLEKKDAALPGPAFISSTQTVSIRPGQASSLCLGGPLRNSVRVVQDRNMLRLTYQLLGVGGEQYEYYNWKNRPRFNIYKGPFKIASGSLPYG